jgi:hypothetical protein
MADRLALGALRCEPLDQPAALPRLKPLRVFRAVGHK